MTDEPVVRTTINDAVAVVTLNRPAKRNAMSSAVFAGLRAAFTELPDRVRAVVLAATGEHFCAGLDLNEFQELPAFDSVRFSRSVHEVYHAVRFCDRPVVAALRGAVVGGGVELACSTHIRVAEPDAFFQLPEGRRGIFVGGGGSVRISRAIGVDRVTEMMLTGRRVGADESHRIGLSHYLVGPGEALPKAMEIAELVAQNAPVSNYMMLHALDAIDDMPRQAGLFAESLAQAMTMTAPESRTGIGAFLNRPAPPLPS